MSKTKSEISAIYGVSEKTVQRSLEGHKPIDNIRPYKYSTETIEAVFGLPPVPDWLAADNDIKRVTKSMFTALIAENKELKTRLERLEAMFNSLQPTTIPDSDGWD